jgi:hypothetical protein
MAIEFDCACGKHLKAKDEAAGKRTKCPFCGAVLTVPQLAAVGASTSPAAAPATGAGSDAISIDDGPPSGMFLPVTPPATDAPAAPAQDAAGAAAAAPNSATTREYKVVTPKDLGFVAKFDPGRLEEALNGYGKQGWSVRAAVVMTLPSHSGPPHDELIVIMER